LEDFLNAVRGAIGGLFFVCESRFSAKAIMGLSRHRVTTTDGLSVKRYENLLELVKIIKNIAFITMAADK
jgi:hypothetical protein